jgi:hypothetical protein
MKIQVKILNIKTVNELPGYWTNEDFIQLLDKMDLPDADKVKPEELRELLYMAITDFEPSEAAEIILTYKLGDQLTAGQIQDISHEMKDEKIAETYANPSFHYDLFNINQLLYRAYKGKFPNTEASIILMEVTGNENNEVNKEVLTKALAQSLSERSIIQRLYGDQVTAKLTSGMLKKSSGYTTKKKKIPMKSSLPAIGWRKKILKMGSTMRIYSFLRRRINEGT